MNDEAYMSMALQLAKGAMGQTSPNPMVGAILVKDQAIVGMGAHLRAGEAHAEVHAIRMAGEKAKGATIYVTLEPCSHYGKTPPCAQAILQAGIRRVVVATLDPNPLVAGKGVGILSEAGLQVRVGVLEEEARHLNEVFFHFITTRKPFVTVKTASTLDGKIATKTGHSRWITGEQAREEVHRLRLQHDAILVGVNTIIADNPALTTRIQGEGTAKQPIRLIMDSTLRIPFTSRVVTDGKAPTWVITTRRAAAEQCDKLRELGVNVVVMEQEQIGIEPMLKWLGESGITSLLVEGGSAVNGAFLQAQSINKMISYFSMKVVGGAHAPTAFGGLGFAQMDEAVLIDHVEIERIGKHDVRISGYPVWPV
ncbi:bifunctional diaminohydroxyphosphoribosylaminopyrimidine deaminase/5-amino-6-(5-phosphoribosylamino)uracil reductase RibD [Brevibacillus ginsengisoli]|uniref:bifunctional diaminohydroxyphosphoribosylaminopyrimidine deaminase/5-amino-6-(5-phosphoribosylamino)uracil reductase RibD n=1 Tax=Brevibacillus ginsengisoli TaxID=363854 RepID=UPI003CEBC591